MTRGPAPQLNDAERFWQAVDQRGADDCWPWTRARTGGRDGDTYGLFTRSRRSPGRRSIYAHRMAFCLANALDPGTFPGSVVVRHACDNPVCCNPQHLEAGTQAENTQDMVDRGRSRRGPAAPGALLTEADVVEIRRRLAAAELHKTIAADFGVCRSAISRIAAGTTWGWLETDAVTRAAERVTVIV